jgi:hypothetical protein
VSAGTHVTGPRAVPLGYRALTVCGGPSQGPSPRNCSAHSVRTGSRPLPVRSTPRRHWPTHHWVGVVWALPRSLAATRGISFDFCAGGTEMFPFPPWPPRRVPRVRAAGCPIRTSTDQRVLGPSPSLLAAVLRPSSAPQRLGIHRLLSVTCRSARPRSCDVAPRLSAMNLVRCAQRVRPTPCAWNPRPDPDQAAERWRCGGSNPEPPPCKGGALPVELHPRAGC